MAESDNRVYLMHFDRIRAQIGARWPARDLAALAQWRWRRARAGEAEGAEVGTAAGGGGLISIACTALSGEDESALASLSSGRCLMTPARVRHCCRSSAASVARNWSIQSWQCLTMRLQKSLVTCSKPCSVCSRASVRERLCVA